MRLAKRSKSLTKTLGLLGLTLLLLGCAGKRIILYPIEQTDIYVKDNGDICMSEFYFNEVLQAKLERK